MNYVHYHKIRAFQRKKVIYERIPRGLQLLIELIDLSLIMQKPRAERNGLIDTSA